MRIFYSNMNLLWAHCPHSYDDSTTADHCIVPCHFHPPPYPYTCHCSSLPVHYRSITLSFTSSPHDQQRLWMQTQPPRQHAGWRGDHVV